MRKRRMRKSSLISLLVLVVGASCLHGHSVHQSTAEVEHNEKAQKLEVSLTVFLDDLEVALIRQCECEMRIDKTPKAEFDEQALAYLKRNFVVTDESGKTSPLKWVGRENDPESAKSNEPKVTLFFEVLLPIGISNTKLRHSVFHDMFKDQSNLLLFRNGSTKEERAFTPHAAIQRLDVPQP